MSRPAERAALTALRIVLVAGSIAGVWLVLAGSTDTAEVIAAVAVGLAAAAAGTRLRRYVGHEHAGLRRWVRHLPRMLVRAYVDCWTLAVVLLRRLRGHPTRGRFRLVSYEVGDDGPDAVGRRVLTVFGTTLQPNSYAVAFDADQGTVLVHELEPTATGPVPDDLRGRP